MDNNKTKIKEITSKIFEQKRQLIVKIPVEITESLKINPEDYNFRWVILEEEGGITISGRFMHKEKNEKKD